MKIDWSSRKRSFAVLIADGALQSAKKIPECTAIEIRLDLLPAGGVDAAFRSLLKRARRAKASVLLTARRKRDGGKWPAARERERTALLLAYAPKVDGLDLEVDLPDETLEQLVLEMRRVSDAAILLSYHEMKHLPSRPRLRALYRKAVALGADRFKVAGLAKSQGEAERFAKSACALARGPVPVTAVAMGAAGSWTRWELPKILGGPTYAPLSHAVAPGQIPFEELSRRLFSR